MMKRTNDQAKDLITRFKIEQKLLAYYKSQSEIFAEMLYESSLNGQASLKLIEERHFYSEEEKLRLLGEQKCAVIDFMKKKKSLNCQVGRVMSYHAHDRKFEERV